MLNIVELLIATTWTKRSAVRTVHPPRLRGSYADGLVGEDVVVEVRCPFTGRNEMIKTSLSKWDAPSMEGMRWSRRRCRSEMPLQWKEWDDQDVVVEVRCPFDGRNEMIKTSLSKWDAPSLEGMTWSRRRCRSEMSLHWKEWHDQDVVVEVRCPFTGRNDMIKTSLSKWDVPSLEGMRWSRRRCRSEMPLHWKEWHDQDVVVEVRCPFNGRNEMIKTSLSKWDAPSMEGMRWSRRCCRSEMPLHWKEWYDRTGASVSIFGISN